MICFSQLVRYRRIDNERFHGDRVLSYDSKTETITDLGMPAFGWGYPSSRMAANHGCCMPKRTCEKPAVSPWLAD